MSSVETNKRRGSRTKAVLPVRIKGKDSSGKAFEELAHTLDLTPTGVRLGSVRRELGAQDEVTIFFRQRKMQFRVVWTKKMKGTSEFQVGLQALTQEREAWGVNFAEPAKQAPQAFDASPVSALA
ncbi:MAG TPA: PilZ domain-containing protein [Candidatus Binatia bacterium]|nr:PilZ domain-containing protein [Candidatus Binatia bacterium]